MKVSYDFVEALKMLFTYSFQNDLLAITIHHVGTAYS